MGTLSPLFSWRSAICDSDLSPTCRHIALTLSLHMNERGGSCFPAVSTLVAETGLSDRTVRDGLKNLVGLGWLLREERKRADGGDTSCIYTATTPLQQLQTPPAAEGEGPPAAAAPQEDVHVEDVNEGATLPAVRPRNELWDALVECISEPTTRPELSRRGKCVKELREAGATPQDVRFRCLQYKLRWPKVSLTDTALVAHWSELGKEQPQPLNLSQSAQALIRAKQRRMQ